MNQNDAPAAVAPEIRRRSERESVATPANEIESVPGEIIEINRSGRNEMCRVECGNEARVHAIGVLIEIERAIDTCIHSTRAACHDPADQVRRIGRGRRRVHDTSAVRK